MGGHGCLAGYLPYEKFHLVFDIVHEVTRNEMLAVYKYIRVYWPKQVFFIGHGNQCRVLFCFGIVPTQPSTIHICRIYRAKRTNVIILVAILI